MEIKYKNEKVFVDEIEFKKDEVNSKKMIDFIDKIIIEDNENNLTITGEVNNPFQDLIKRVVEGATNDEFKEEINKLEKEQEKLNNTEKELGEMDLSYPSTEEEN